MTIPGEKRYFINQDLWDQLDNDNRAGLLLHEFIYRELRTPTSVKVRCYNSIISSNLLNQISLTEIIQIHLNAGLDSIDINGVQVNIHSKTEFYPKGNLKLAYPIPGSRFEYLGQKLTLSSYFDIEDPRIPKIEFHEAGGLKAIAPDQSIELRVGMLELRVHGYPEHPITFWENGILESGYVRMRVIYFGRIKVPTSKLASTPTLALDGVVYSDFTQVGF